MRTLYEFTTESGYVFNKKSGMLEEFKLTRIGFDLEDECVIYQGVTWSGERIIKEKDFVLYESVEGYEANKPTGRNNKVSVESIFHDMKVVRETDRILGWIFKDGQPCLSPLDGCLVSYDISDCGSIKWGSMQLSTDERFYKSREDAIANNEVVVVDSEGNKTTRVGLAKAIQLNDEQKELLKKFVEAGNALVKSGVVLGYNNANSTLVCRNEVEGVEFDCDWGDGYICVNDYCSKVNLPIDDYLPYDGLFMKYKN